MVLEMKNLKKCYGDNEALKHIDLQLTPGIYGLLGPNGAGKSTLMKLICMLLDVTEGGIFFNGINIHEQKKTFLTNLGYMPQHSCLYAEFDVEEYMFYIGALKGIEKNILHIETENLLKKVHLFDVKNQKIKTLSGGMQQRLMFAQALLGKPKVLILDEPTAGLDPKKRIEMRNQIAEYAKDNIILIATHVVSDVELIASKILLLKHGELIAVDEVQGLTRKLDGKVYEIRIENSLEQLEHQYQVSSMYQRDGKVYGKILVEDGMTKPENAVKVFPDLEDVYLYYFGEEEK